MDTPRIVLDTNCLIQILGAKTKYHYLFSEFLNGNYILCISTEILLEYEEILCQKASTEAADLFLKVIARSRNVIQKDPFFRLEIIKADEDDNKFVDCAFACQADFIVTNDKHFEEVTNSPFPHIQVLSLDEFSALILP